MKNKDYHQVPSETRNFLVNIHPYVSVSWWRRRFAIKHYENLTKLIKMYIH
jgi:hypothetical protein